MLNGKEVNKMTLTQKHQRNLRKELIRERRSNIIGNLAKTALVIGIFVGASIGVGKFAYTGIKRLEDNVIISSYNETVNNPISQGDTYWNYAKNLQEQYPELKGLNVNDLAEEIQKLNDHKKLNYLASVELPVYDLSERISQAERE